MANLDESSLTNLFAITGLNEVAWYRYEALCSGSLAQGIRRGLEGVAAADPVLAANIELSRRGVCCCWRPQPINSHIHELWLFELTPERFQVERETLQPKLTLSASGFLSPERDEVYSFFLVALTQMLQRHLVRQGFTLLGSYLIFPPQLMTIDLEQSSLPACSWSFSLNAGILFCRFQLHRLWIKRLSSVSFIQSDIQVLISPTGGSGRIIRAVSQVPSGLYNVFSNMLGFPDLSNPNDSPTGLNLSSGPNDSAVLCQVHNAEITLPISCIFIPTSSPADAFRQPMDAVLMRSLLNGLFSSLQTEMDPSVATDASKPPLVLHRPNPIDFWKYIDPSSYFEDTSKMPAAESPTNMISMPSQSSNNFDRSSSTSTMPSSSSTYLSRTTATSLLLDSNIREPMDSFNDLQVMDDMSDFLNFFDNHKKQPEIASNLGGLDNFGPSEMDIQPISQPIQDAIQQSLSDLTPAFVPSISQQSMTTDISTPSQVVPSLSSSMLSFSSSMTNVSEHAQADLQPPSFATKRSSDATADGLPSYATTNAQSIISKYKFEANVTSKRPKLNYSANSLAITNELPEAASPVSTEEEAVPNLSRDQQEMESSSSDDSDSSDDDENPFDSSKASLSLPTPVSINASQSFPNGSAISLEACNTIAVLFEQTAVVIPQNNEWTPSQVFDAPCLLGLDSSLASIVSDPLPFGVANSLDSSVQASWNELLYIIQQQAIVTSPFGLLDSPHTQMARRSFYSQLNNGDKMLRVDSLSDCGQVLRVLLDLHAMLVDVFTETYSPVSASSAMALTQRTVKGPLSIDQLSILADAESFAQYEKNPKFSRKKKNQASSVDFLPPPQLLMGFEGSLIQATPKILRFWDRLSLEPYSPKKELIYVALVPQNTDVINASKNYFRDLSSTFEMCKLGHHAPFDPTGLAALATASAQRMASSSIGMALGGYNGSNGHSGLVVRQGIIEVPNAKSNETAEGLAAFMEVCVHLTKLLDEFLTSQDQPVNVIVYMINPFRSEWATYRLCQVFTKLIKDLSKPLRKAFIHLQLIPIDHVIVSCLMHGLYHAQLKELAFSVYSKCRCLFVNGSEKPFSGKLQTLQQHTNIVSIYAPAVVLSRPKLSRVSLAVNSGTSTGSAWERVMHLAYSHSIDRRWIVSCWTDDRGELLDTDVVALSSATDRKKIFERMWSHTIKLMNQVALAWRVVIGKLGSYTSPELQDWFDITSQDTRGMKINHILPVQPLTGNIPYRHRINSISWISADYQPMLHLFDSRVIMLPSSMSSSVAAPSSTSLSTLSRRTTTSDAQSNNQNEDVLFVSLRKLTFGGLVGLATGLMVDLTEPKLTEIKTRPNIWPATIELSIFGHVYRTDVEGIHSPFFSWSSSDATLPSSILADIAKQYRHLAYLGIAATPLSEPPMIPWHMTIVERLSRIIATATPSPSS